MKRKMHEKKHNNKRKTKHKAKNWTETKMKGDEKNRIEI